MRICTNYYTLNQELFIQAAKYLDEAKLPTSTVFEL